MMDATLLGGLWDPIGKDGILQYLSWYQIPAIILLIAIIIFWVIYRRKQM